jgi:hypothetical protein
MLRFRKQKQDPKDHQAMLVGLHLKDKQQALLGTLRFFIILV